jgi:hypothetical protein
VIKVVYRTLAKVSYQNVAQLTQRQAMMPIGLEKPLKLKGPFLKLLGQITVIKIGILYETYNPMVLLKLE